MFNLTILFLAKIYDFQSSPFTSSIFVKRKCFFSSFSISNSRMNFFSQSFIKDYTSTNQKNIFIQNSRFQRFLRSPIHIYSDDKLKLFEDLTYKKKRFKIKGGTLIIKRCVFIQNQAKKGGGLNSEHNLEVNITDCIFSTNSATFGGGFYIEQADSAYLSRILVENNSAEYLGGLFLDGNSEGTKPFSNVDNMNVTNNKAKEWTGGVRFDHGGGTFKNSVLSSNSAKVCGGFFDQCWKPSKRFVCFTLFFNNSAADRVGGYCAFHIMHQSMFENCFFIKNSCASSANSIFIESIDSVVEIKNCFFDKNKDDELKMKFEFSKFVLSGNNTFNRNKIESNAHQIIVEHPNTPKVKSEEND